MVRTLVTNQNTHNTRELQIGGGDQHLHKEGFLRVGIRLDFLYFSGDNPAAQVFKANQYFDLYQIAPP